MLNQQRTVLEKTSVSSKILILIIVDIITFLCMGLISQFLVAGNIHSLNFAQLCVEMILQIVVLALLKYYLIRLSDSSIDLILRAASGLLICFIAFTATAGIRKGFTSREARWNFIYNFACLVGTLATRYVYRLFGFYRFKTKSSTKPKAIIYGAGEIGSAMIRLARKDKFGYDIIGFIDDNPNLHHRLIQGVPVLGNIDEFDAIARTEDVDTFIIAITIISAEKIQKAVEIAKKNRLAVKIIPRMFESNHAPEVSVRDIDYADLLGRHLITPEIEPVQELFEGKTIMVTGAGGSIGSEICRQLMGFSPKKLIALDIDETELHDLGMRLLRYKAEWSDQVVPVVCDIKNGRKVEKIFSEYKPDIVLHAAAYKHVPLMELYPEEAIMNNIYGSYNVFRSAKNNGVKRVIVISTDKAVNPTNIMGSTKRVVEMMASALNSAETEFCCVRFGNVIGSRGSMLPIFLEEIHEGVPITVTDKRIIRYFMAIKEAVGLVFRAATIAKGGEVMVLDMGEPVKIYDFAQKLITTFGDGRSQIVITGLRPGEKLYEELLANKDNTIPTENEKIFRAKVCNDPKYTEQYLADAISKMPEKTTEELVELLKEAVPEYHQPERDKK